MDQKPWYISVYRINLKKKEFLTYLHSCNMFEEGDKTVIVRQSKPANLLFWGDV